MDDSCPPCETPPQAPGRNLGTRTDQLNLRVPWCPMRPGQDREGQGWRGTGGKSEQEPSLQALGLPGGHGRATWGLSVRADGNMALTPMPSCPLFPGRAGPSHPPAYLAHCAYAQVPLVLSRNERLTNPEEEKPISSCRLQMLHRVHEGCRPPGRRREHVCAGVSVRGMCSLKGCRSVRM